MRWTMELDQLVRLQPDGRTRQGMAGAMRFLCYYCPSSSCGAEGYCAEFCADCKRGLSQMKAKSTAGESTGARAAHEKEFQAWRAKQPSGAPVTKAAYNKANPKAVSGGGASAATSKVEAFTSQTSAMDFLSLRQEIVREPRSAADV